MMLRIANLRFQLLVHVVIRDSGLLAKRKRIGTLLGDIAAFFGWWMYKRSPSKW